MITKKMIREGIRTNLIRFIVDPNMKNGTVCQICDGWFYFGGTTAEEMNPDDYIFTTPIEDIVQEIFDTLEDFRNNEETKDEYDYYEAILVYGAEAENRELLSIINAVRDAPKIDSIHAAGGCYCYECTYYSEYEEWDRNTQKSYKAYECKILKRDFGSGGFCCIGKVKNNT